MDKRTQTQYDFRRDAIADVLAACDGHEGLVDDGRGPRWNLQLFRSRVRVVTQPYEYAPMWISDAQFATLLVVEKAGMVFSGAGVFAPGLGKLSTAITVSALDACVRRGRLHMEEATGEYRFRFRFTLTDRGREVLSLARNRGTPVLSDEEELARSREEHRKQGNCLLGGVFVSVLSAKWAVILVTPIVV